MNDTCSLKSIHSNYGAFDIKVRNLKNIDDITEGHLHAWLKNMLTVHPLTVTFTKVDGTERVMRCTLKDDLLPEAYRGKGTVLTEVTNALRVYDLDNSGWRSIRVESVLQLSVVPSGSQAQLLV